MCSTSSPTPAGAPAEALPPAWQTSDYIQLTANWSRELIAIIDGEGRFIYASSAYGRVLGYDDAALAGSSLFDLIHAADLAVLLEQWSASTDACALHHVCRMQHADGSWRWVDLTLAAADELPGKIICTARDVTESRQAELLLARLLRQNDLILNAIGEGVVGLDDRGNTTFVNSAATRMLGLEAVEMLGRPFHSLVLHGPTDDPSHPADLSPLFGAFRDGPLHQFAAASFRRSDGRLLPVSYVCTPILQSGTVAGAVVVFRDNSERQQLEAQVLQTQKMESVGQLASTVAHDFNNLLTSIVGYANLARMMSPEDSSTLEFLEEIEKSGYRAAGLTRQLLAFARKQVIEPHLMSLNELLRDMEKLLRSLIPADIKLRVELEAELPLVKADPGQLSQVVVNLVVNARDAMPDGGLVTLTTAQVQLAEDDAERPPALLPGPYVCLTVGDTGIGIPPDLRARIFEPFFTTKDPGKGTGLGLASSQGIVRQHFGEIVVDSAPNRGTRFRIYLPQAMETAPAADAQVDEAPSGGTEQILVVDDDDSVRRLLVSVLREAGYTVREAADGRAALDLLRAPHRAPELLLTDIVMPGLRGTALAHQAMAEHLTLRVLYTSGHLDESLLQHGQLVPDVPFLMKPFSAADLLRKVRQVLDA